MPLSSQDDHFHGELKLKGVGVGQARIRPGREPGLVIKTIRGDETLEIWLGN